MADSLYTQARRLFDDNLTILKRSETDPVQWNLSRGLALLASALEEDIPAIKTKLQAIDSDVKSIR
jgi:hypothetical protein